MYQKRKIPLKDNIRGMVQEIEAMQHVIQWTKQSVDKDKHTAWECVATAVNKVEQKDTTVMLKGNSLTYNSHF